MAQFKPACCLLNGAARYCGGYSALCDALASANILVGAAESRLRIKLIIIEVDVHFNFLVGVN